jgi:putative oxidoreductase
LSAAGKPWTKVTANGGWRLELQALFLFGALAISLMGAGRFSLGGQGGRWN